MVISTRTSSDCTLGPKNQRCAVCGGIHPGPFKSDLYDVQQKVSKSAPSYVADALYPSECLPESPFYPRLPSASYNILLNPTRSPPLLSQNCPTLLNMASVYHSAA